MHYAGNDVALKESAVCVMDGDGRVVREARLPSDPDAIAGFLEERGVEFGRIGLEAGCTAGWLFAGLQARRSPPYAWSRAMRRPRSVPASATRATATTRGVSPTWCG